MMRKVKNPVLYLPHELIIQILLRLPVKSLIRFKCVCKSWFSIISSDPQFANSQFQLTAATHTHRALIISIVSPHETLSIDLEESLDDDNASVSLNPNFLASGIAIKGSCRGFILLHCSSSLSLWNPSTGVYTNIPSGYNLDADADAENFYGFGYDQSTDDYLIVSISSDTDSSYLEFFSIRANTWKQIDPGTYIHHTNTIFDDDPRVGLFFNGAIHWFAHFLDLKKKVIVAFDLMERKLLDMHFPDQFISELDYCGLWVFQEFLSLWSMNYSNDTVQIWVMKEYKLHSSWTKTHVLPSDTSSTLYFFPLHCTKRGDIVGVDDNTILMKYNDDGQLLEHRSYDNDPCGYHVTMYTESLLSLPEDDAQA
ncbi:F-box/kelch-repeat protein At3g06240-like [Trifolium pratense]|uniref:F-box/kelch-repeat protein At3g06240-like n=1 Tax=Trifolium pratense TaxID=57577 RepID=UPI001E6973A7|nr:F-box/kelch-repeat protein At3g06240-like [Trifolium pratense]XP_045805713.1 F-box/kelch-repeat protein At3g06240-like [Trifolium pratense]